MTIKYSQMIGSTPSVRDVAQFAIPAGSTKEVGLDILEGDPDLRNSFLISSDASPGDVSAKLVATSDSLLREVELEAKDEMDPQNGGNHPWSLEDGTESTLLIFNHSSDTQVFNVAISAGGVNWSKAYRLASMQTEAISIRELITNKVKDDYDVVLPLNATRGEVSWFGFQPGLGKGRLLQSNRDMAMARNFSCGIYLVLCGDDYTPGPSGFGLGFTAGYGPIDGRFCQTNSQAVCSGDFTSRSTADSYKWWSANTSIAFVSGSSTNKSSSFYGAGWGTTRINGEVSTTYCKFIAPQNVAVNCGDNRDHLIPEYPMFHADFTPTCADFTRSASSTHYSFPTYNTSDSKHYLEWAILRSYLLSGVEAAVTIYRSAPTMTSGYRSPQVNSGIAGSSPTSRHIHGDAVDLYSGYNTNTWTALHNAAIAAGAVRSGRAALRAVPGRAAFPGIDCGAQATGGAYSAAVT